MLNRIHACVHRIVNSIESHRVRRHLVPLAMGLLHNRAQLIQREGWNVIEHAIFPHPVRPIAIHLDPVRSMTDLLAHGLPRRICPIDHLHSVRHRHIRGIPEQGISSSYVQSPSRNLHPRPRNYSVVDRLLHVRIGIAGPLGLQVANGSESIIQRPPRIYRGHNRPVLRRLL